VSVKAKDGSSRFLVSMNDDELDTLRAWAQDKGNTYMVAAIDAIQASRDAADEVEPLDSSLPF
jgi:molybdenum cofactor biosynthesis enzyme